MNKQRSFALKGVATLAVSAVSMLGLAACSSDGAKNGAEEGEVRIGALYLDSQGYYGGVKAGVAAAAEESGTSVKMLETTSAGDVSKESSFMNTLVSSGVSAIIVAPVSADGSVPAIKQAHDAGIPVICYNTCVNDEAREKYVSAYIVGNPTEFGRQLGEAAVAHFTEAGVKEPKIGVINCEQYEVCKERLAGFESALTEGLPGAQISANQEGAEVDRAVSVAEQMLSANSDLDGLYGEAGGATVGAFKAVAARNLTGKVAVFGSDMTSDIATELKSGDTLKAVVDISGIEVGRLAFASAHDLIAGNTPEKSVIDAKISLYLPADAEGWLTAHPDGLP